MPGKTLNAAFTAEKIVVDGIRDDAYRIAEIAFIACAKHGVDSADYPGERKVRGTLQSLLDGRTLYLFVDVTDPIPARNTVYAGKDKGESVGDGDSYDWEKFHVGDR